MDLKRKIQDTERKVTSLDDEVKEYLENNYAKFAILLEENHLMIKARDLLSEVENLQNLINTQVNSWGGASYSRQVPRQNAFSNRSCSVFVGEQGVGQLRDGH